VPNGTKSTSLDPNADRAPAEPHAKLKSVPRAPQQNQSAAARSPYRQLGPPRPRQLHQQVPPGGPPQKSALAPQ
jgi:hypothetical protein